MKELLNHDRLNDRARIEAEQSIKQQHELKFDGSIRPMEGHTLFEINTTTKEIKQAEFISHKTIDWNVAIDIINGKPLERKVVQKRGCVYISALNKENALYRYNKLSGSAKKQGVKPLKLWLWT